MYRETFTTFLKDLTDLDPNELTLVLYDEKSHNLLLRQYNKTIVVSYLNLYYLPKKGFKIGLLTQAGLNKLMSGLNQLLGSDLIDKFRIVPDIQVLGTDWYTIFPKQGLPYPQKLISLRYVNITSKFWTWMLCNTFNSKSKLLYKLSKVN